MIDYDRCDDDDDDLSLEVVFPSRFYFLGIFSVTSSFILKKGWGFNTIFTSVMCTAVSLLEYAVRN